MQSGLRKYVACWWPAPLISPSEARLLTNSVEAAIDAALDDLGIARALSYQVDAHVRAGQLRYVLPEFDPPGVPVSLLFQATRRGSPNVRALIVAAQEYFC